MRGWTQLSVLGPAAASGAPGPVPLPHISFQLQLPGQPNVSSELQTDLAWSQCKAMNDPGASPGDVGMGSCFLLIMQRILGNSVGISGGLRDPSL